MTIVKGPLEVTIVAWIALALALVRLFTYAGVFFILEAQENLVSMGIHKSEKALLLFPLPVHYLVSGVGVGVAIFMAAGIGLLRAGSWARITLALWSGWILLFAFLTTGSFVYVAPKLLGFVVMVVILFSPRANAYLSSGPGLTTDLREWPKLGYCHIGNYGDTLPFTLVNNSPIIRPRSGFPELPYPVLPKRSVAR